MAEQPMYRRIADDLLAGIESGALAHGAQLPTELELRDQYRASRNTIRDALKWLMNRGLVETRPGQGTFVVEKIDPFVTTLSAELDTGFGGEGTAYASEVRARHRKPATSIPRVEVQHATGVIASELQLDEGSQVVSRHQQRNIDGTPYSLQTTFYPERHVDQGATNLIQASDMPEGVVSYLQKALHIKQVGWRDRITVRAPNANEAAFFKLPDDGRVAMFEIFQTGFDQEARPIRLTVSVYPTDRNQFAINVGQVPDEALNAPLLESPTAATESPPECSS